MMRTSMKNRTTEVRQSGSRQETADDYAGTVCMIAEHWRVVVCKDNWQWIIQRRERGTAGRPWRGTSYHRSRDALIRRCGGLGLEIDPAATCILAALPKCFSQTATKEPHGALVTEDGAD